MQIAQVRMRALAIPWSGDGIPFCSDYEYECNELVFKN
jgi:hypothetical protein